MAATVQLSPDELALAREGGSAMRRRNLGIGSAECQKDNKRSGEEVHQIGLIGEFCVRKYFGIPLVIPDLDGPDDGVDLVHHGVSIQIKTITKQGWTLMFDSHAAFKSQRAILVQLFIEYPGRAAVHGWCTRETFFEKSQSRNMPRVGVRELLPFDLLISMERWA